MQCGACCCAKGPTAPIVRYFVHSHEGVVVGLLLQKFEAHQSSLLPERSLSAAARSSSSVRDDGKSVRDASTKVLYPHMKGDDKDAVRMALCALGRRL